MKLNMNVVVGPLRFCAHEFLTSVVNDLRNQISTEWSSFIDPVNVCICVCVIEAEVQTHGYWNSVSRGNRYFLSQGKGRKLFVAANRHCSTPAPSYCRSRNRPEQTHIVGFDYF